MTYLEAHAEIAKVVTGKWCLSVKQWQEGPAEWELWIADWGQHLRARTPERVLDLIKMGKDFTAEVVF